MTKRDELKALVMTMDNEQVKALHAAILAIEAAPPERVREVLEQVKRMTDQEINELLQAKRGN